MKVFWTGLSILGIAVTLSSCSSHKDESHYKTPVQKPCIIPTGLSNDAMGKVGIQVIQIGHNYRIVIPTDDIFEIRSSEIKSSAHPALNQLASYLSHFSDHRMIVAGYTDELGTYERDSKLANHQAQSLITYLWTQGVAHQCLTPIGMGKDDRGTIASNRSIEGKAYNRRIEITFRA